MAEEDGEQDVGTVMEGRRHSGEKGKVLDSVMPETLIISIINNSTLNEMEIKTR